MRVTPTPSSPGAYRSLLQPAAACRSLPGRYTAGCSRLRHPEDSL